MVYNENILYMLRSSTSSLHLKIIKLDIDRINIREEHSKPTIREDTYSKMVSNLKTHIEENDWDSEAPNKLLEIFNDLSETLAGLDERIDAMEQSQSVYHEDSQVLWWMLSKWSEISNCSLNNSDYLQKARKYGHFTGYKN